MAANLPIFRRLVEALRTRDWFGIAFELFVVALGVVLGLEASRWASEREEREYRMQMITALEETLSDFEFNGRRIDSHIQTALDEHAKLAAGGGHPSPPILHITGLDRPPTRTWDALVATGLARSLDPKLVLRLAVFFSRADAYGDQYQRYNRVTEQDILPYVSDPGKFYGPDGKLRPQYASHVDRLRDLQSANGEVTSAATELRRDLPSKH